MNFNNFKLYIIVHPLPFLLSDSINVDKGRPRLKVTSLLIFTLDRVGSLVADPSQWNFTARSITLRLGNFQPIMGFLTVKLMDVLLRGI